jgi:conjugal transfer pilus assembly protein TraW
MASRVFPIILVCAALGFSGAAAVAKDYGVVGSTFVPVEESLIDMFQRKLDEAGRSGRLAEIEADMKARVVAGVSRPKPVAGLSPATQYFAYDWDPTVVAQEDYRDLNGRIVVPKGQTVNPLDVNDMGAVLLFVDGDNPAELAWAFERSDALSGAARIILVDGSPIEVMRTHKRRVYFDQQSMLSKQFALKHTPSSIRQDGRKLLIEEFPLEPSR